MQFNEKIDATNCQHYKKICSQSRVKQYWFGLRITNFINESVFKLAQGSNTIDKRRI